MKVGVIGTGSWGTALAQVLCDNNIDVLIWGRSAIEVDSINNEHKLSYLGNVLLNENLKATKEFKDVIEEVSVKLNLAEKLAESEEEYNKIRKQKEYIQDKINKFIKYLISY